METKKCPRCNKEKSLDEFHFKKSENRYNSWCKKCFSAMCMLRWKDRKRKAVELLGNKCFKCGYSKNLAALCFHHRDPKIKEFGWVELRLKKWESIVEELKKCDLLCSNCHNEIHSPDQNLILIDTGSSNSSLNNEEKNFLPTGKCPTCEKYVYGTKYCSTKCASNGNRKVVRPSKEELDALLKDSNINAISKKYGVSWQSIKKWIKQYNDTPVAHLDRAKDF